MFGFKKKKSYVIRRVTGADLNNVYSLVTKVGMECKATGKFVYSLDKSYYDKLIKTGLGLVAIYENEIVGCFLTYTSNCDEEGVYAAARLGASDIKNTVVFDTCAVDREHRGNGLQFTMGKQLIAATKKRGYKYGVCTIHPENQSSLDNMKKLGFKIVAMRKMYINLDRYILIKVL